MRFVLYSFCLSVLALAGCQDQATPRTNAPPPGGSSAAGNGNAATRADTGDSDRSENPLKSKDETEPPIPSSASPDIDSARGDEPASAGGDR